MVIKLMNQWKEHSLYTQLMFETTPLACTLWNKDHVVIECNAEVPRLFGLSSKEEFGERFLELSPEYQPCERLSSELAFEYIDMAFADGYCRVEWTHQTLNGDLIPSEITLIRVKHGKQDLVAAYMRDLREFKAMMTNMREADERTQIMFDATPLCVNFWNKNRKNIDCNQEAVKMFGLSNKQEYLDRFYELSPKYQPDGKDSTEKTLQLINETFTDGYCRFEWLHQKLDGELVPCEITLVRVKQHGEFIVVGYARDLREHKAMLNEMRKVEIAEESNKAKSKFLAMMSHEIRTPMNAILGITEIQMRNKTISPEIHEALGKIYNSADLLLRIINDILDLSKIEAGKLELLSIRYDVANMINDAVQVSMTRIGSKMIRFQLNVDPAIPSELTGDELRIKQILNNLLSNAFKYTESGEVTLSIKAEFEGGAVALAPDGSQKVTLVIVVSDTGQGMTIEQINELFGEYSRLNAEANRLIQGTGLGMNITKQLVQMMGGDIAVKSEPEKGSTFTVRLPQKATGLASLGRELAESLQRFRFNAGLQIKTTQLVREPMPYGSALLVDDVETNLYVAKGLLMPYELAIDTAMSGFEAIDKIKAGNVYDVIFMDHMMPKMDGIEATRIIREQGYRHPIVALTANAVAGQAEMFLLNGFDDFISKPIDIRQLNAVLNKLIRDKQSHDVLEAARKGSIKNAAIAAVKASGGSSGVSQSSLDAELAKIFVRDADKAVKTLEAIGVKGSALDENDLQTYTTTTHAMKSALANIGEAEFSGIARRLEAAGRERNSAIIIAETPIFLDGLRAVLRRIAALGEDEGSDGVDEDTALLHEKIAVFREACEAYDKKAAKEALIALNKQKWSRQTKEKLNILTEHLLHSDFEDALSVAREL